MEARLDPIFTHAVSSQQIPGIAVVVLEASGRTIFSKGYGRTRVDDPESPLVTPASCAPVNSLSKLVTSTALFQLIEQGKVSLEAAVEEYVPEIARIQRLVGFDENGEPVLKDPQKKPTVLQLLTHTTGFAYDMFNEDNLRWRIASGGTPNNYTAPTREAFYSPFLFEPGSRFEYGVNIDWVGYIVERVSGTDLGTFVQDHISGPLGLQSWGSPVSSRQDQSVFNVHRKDSKGQLTSQPLPPEKNRLCHGGHFLHSNAQDYSQVLLTVLNHGTHPVSRVKILEPETVKGHFFTDAMPRLGCPPNGLGEFRSALPHVTNNGSLMPGVKKGFSAAGLLLNLEDLPNGRRQGSGAWAGMSNCYYWMDPTAGRLAVVVTCVLPFMDRDVLHLFDALERAAYDKPAANKIGESGSNFEGGFNMVKPRVSKD